MKVLIVEDDPMVAQLNKQHTERVEGFEVMGVTSNAEQAMHFIEQNEVDLILLDVFMPGINGIHFLRGLRKQNEDVDVILITAACQMDQIQQSLRLGAVDYLIKPFEYDRLKEALVNYRESQLKFPHQNTTVTQQEVDFLLRKERNEQKEKNSIPAFLPKGLTPNTLQTVIESIENMDSKAFTTNEIADATRVSRVSVRKYLKFLNEIGFLEENLVYGVGRPIYKYYVREHDRSIINRYM
ncbi:response regulator [Pontibacillus salicampi]|uniref:Response regulator n=1 Tax=Pontibacillus salicampi TaxID=1449801 RepID=A0ABV6LQX9_9BACI